MIHEHKKTCPKCGSPKIGSWAELTDEQKFTVERLPMSAEYSHKERKKHRFCTKCWFEQVETEVTLA